MVEVVHPRLPPRRSTTLATTWWGRAWVRAVEESAYAPGELARGRALARAGRVGGIAVEEGGLLAAVEDDAGVWTVVASVPVLDGASAAALVETVAAESGRVAALLDGDLPHSLVEHAEEAGVELLPYGGELGATCTCEAWTDPCEHALAVLHQVARLLDADPFVLLHLRGLPREELLARLHALDGSDDPDPAEGEAARPDGDVETALDAVVRATRVLELLDGDDPDPRLEHLL